MQDPQTAIILNVDDDDGVRYATTRVLRRAGYTVVEAATGTGALQQVAEARPDLILLDVNLPDMLGFEVVRRLKADPFGAAIPVMHLSATAVEDSHVIEGLETGADMYLTQPLDPQVLLASVRALLRVRQAEGERTHALRLSALAERRLRVVVANTRTQLAYLASDFTFVLANAAFARRCGHTPEELVGRNYFEVFPEEGARCLFERVKDTAQPVALHERPLESASGTSYWDWVLSPVVADDGTLDGLVLSLTDVTENVRQREQEVARERARAELAETLVREMSHRIKNNLAMVAGLLQVQTAQQQDQRISAALQEATSRVLAFAHVHEQMQASALGRINLLEATNQIVETARTTLGRQQVAISIQGEPVECSAKTAVNLAVIVNELVTNAMKHGAPGRGGVLEVTLSLRLAGDQLHLSVWNSGNPVPEGFRLAEQRGLGLQLVRALVQDQQGFLTVAPERGGTKVRLSMRLLGEAVGPGREGLASRPGIA